MSVYLLIPGIPCPSCIPILTTLPFFDEKPPINQQYIVRLTES